MHLFLAVFVFTAALLGLAWGVVSRRRSPGRSVASTPTIMGAPATSRPLNGVERAAYRLLRDALPPGYLLLPQVALSRFIRVSHRTSYRAWYDLIGHRCVDFLLCNSEGEVVMVVELDEQAGRNPRYQQVVQRKARVLDVAGVPVIHWCGSDLPSPAQVRDLLAQSATSGGLRARPLAAAASDPAPLTPRAGIKPVPLPERGMEAAGRPLQMGAPEAMGRDFGDTLAFEGKGTARRSV